MTTELSNVTIPDFGLPESRPVIPGETYAARCDALVAGADCDWVVVYSDREHQANIAFLTGFEPRFEEALLLLNRDGRRIIVTGNECVPYAAISGLPGVEVELAQSLSLMGQDRTEAPKLTEVLSGLGMASGQTVGIAGWKYLEEVEYDDAPSFFVPHHLVATLTNVAGDAGLLSDVTPVLMHETKGLRAVVDADEIAWLEFGAARASAAVWRVVTNAKPGDTEHEAASNMGYAGEQMACHFMLSTNGGSGPIIGLSSPSGKVIEKGDGITTCVGLWGGISARGGLMAEGDDTFLAKCKGYFEALLTWYETAEIGVDGAVIYDAVEKKLAEADLEPALNPGHLLSHDEWMNTPVRRKNSGKIASGMPFQVDIIPVPMLDGQTLNCEDAIVFADADLRAEIEKRHPEVYARMMARRAFIADVIGIELSPSILPLSSTPLCLAPFWLKSSEILVRKA